MEDEIRASDEERLLHTSQTPQENALDHVACRPGQVATLSFADSTCAAALSQLIPSILLELRTLLNISPRPWISTAECQSPRRCIGNCKLMDSETCGDPLLLGPLQRHVAFRGERVSVLQKDVLPNQFAPSAAMTAFIWSSHMPGRDCQE